MTRRTEPRELQRSHSGVVECGVEDMCAVHTGPNRLRFWQHLLLIQPVGHAVVDHSGYARVGQAGVLYCSGPHSKKNVVLGDHQETGRVA